MGTLTTALRKKKTVKFLMKIPQLLPQCIAYYLTANYVEKNPFKRVIHL